MKTGKKTYLTARQLAARLGVSEASVCRWRRDGFLPDPSPAPGRRLRWSLETIEMWEQNGFQWTAERVDTKRVDVAALQRRLDEIEGQIVAVQGELQRLAAETRPDDREVAGQAVATEKGIEQ